MDSPLTILLTGAAGLSGSGLRPVLQDRGHRVRLLDKLPTAPTTTETAIVADLTDLDAVRAAARGVDVIVHLGGHSREQSWDELAQVNVEGTRTVLEAARLEGVRHLLIASSTHAVGVWPIPEELVDYLPIRPDSLYGVSKAAMEALASAYADRHDLVISLARIGTIHDKPNSVRTLSTWLSLPDLARLVEATARYQRAGAHLVWAVSANSRGWFSLEPGRRIGYEPKDNAEDFADTVSDDPIDQNGLIGGAFADDTHPLGVHW
ncbi:NAD-dependent epimerase/dehydratase family protein [Ruania rhizosphaerae]|uniref:NAD-dependent epimerase/dehydratase family protein n=1 Tax=Ruania rhizosphaerae TaxID=1840413 RepID=UPI001F31897B|nr:NAD(P)-dependent oxidoreductase [Ruania rhizosphaerae]